MPHTPPATDEFADLSAADEYEVGHMDGYTGQVPRALLHPDLQYARRYREGYLAGRREARTAPPEPVTTADDGDEIPF